MLMVGCLIVGVQAQQKPVTKKAAPHVNESTSAGWRPGRDTLTRAKHLYKSFADPAKEPGESAWDDPCRKCSLIVSYDQKQTIETIRVSRGKGSIDADCFEQAKTNPWRTGHGSGNQ
jgi:hypothetical protein